MPRTRYYRDLLVWQKAMELAREVYTRSEEFPKTETFGLRMQMRRSAVAVPSHIAESRSMSCKRRPSWPAKWDLWIRIQLEYSWNWPQKQRNSPTDCWACWNLDGQHKTSQLADWHFRA